jgi:hypothetical protein
VQLPQGVHLIGVHLRQVAALTGRASHRRAPWPGGRLSQGVHLIGVRLRQAAGSYRTYISQVYILNRRPALTGHASYRASEFEKVLELRKVSLQACFLLWIAATIAGIAKTRSLSQASLRLGPGRSGLLTYRSG